MKNKMCSYVGEYKHHDYAKKSISHDLASSRDTSTKELIRVKCPKCKRRIWGQTKYCHDGCCTLIRVPPHKRKGWWKKPKKKARGK
ncbi:hypothetical protein LCGC14_0869450 [marine sediment metagenome]|uniref:Uncharacterized protein n=1 Tax=marine sediment metagenome TaxID=412755 RepID=A0A0F9P9X5_9ZZZZ